MIGQKEKELLKVLWDYMVLDQKIEKCDAIIGCGCANLKIPIICSDLLKQGYANHIIFTGGVGKITANLFPKSEAEIYKEIAIVEGIEEKRIWTETKSKNTADNFRFIKKLLEEEELPWDRFLIVHNRFSERRTLATAKAILPEMEFFITSSGISFEQFFSNLKCRERENEVSANQIVSVIVGDIQRIIIFSQFGWQIRQEVPKKVIEAYEKLKQLGYTTYIFSKEQIQKMIQEHGIIKEEKPNYFI